MQIKIKFKDERLSLDADKKRLVKEAADGHVKLEDAHNRLYALKAEIEESPLQVLR